MDTSRGGASLVWPGLMMMVLLGVGGIVVTSRPLQTPRPAAPAMLWNEAGSEGQAPARLWQDPLQATHKHYELVKGAGHEGRPIAPTLEKDLAGQIAKEADAHSLLILPVPVNGDPWPDSEDARIQDRYALLSALGTAGFTPDNRESVKYVLTTRLRPDPLSQGVIIPYEWLSRDAPGHDEIGERTTGTPREAASSPFDKVLVLWLRYDCVPSNGQLETIARLIGALGLHGKIEPDRLEVTVLTRTSNRLVDLLVEDAKLSRPWQSVPHNRLTGSWLSSLLRSLEHAHTLAALSGVEFVNFTGSVPRVQLEGQIARALGPMLDTERGTPLAERLNDETRPVEARSNPPRSYSAAISRELAEKTQVRLLSGPCLKRSIGTDDALTHALVKELGLRGANPANPRNHVALVHEWDSVYGRSILATFKESCRDADRSRGGTRYGVNGTAGDGWTADDETEWKKNIHSYTFMRGVDGVLPAVMIGEAPTSAKPESRDIRKSLRLGESELPSGRGQLDYIRRLVGQIREDKALWWANGRGRLAAVGVFGTDAYDKLPLLQALREAFPEVLFFTADIQAALTHPSVYGTMRNLIIASPFDLRLGKDLQGSTPPFRTTYQTALFYATLLAVEQGGASMLESDLILHSEDAAGHARNQAMVDGLPAREILRKADRARIEGSGRARVYEVGRGGAYDLSTDGNLQALFPPGPRTRRWLPDWRSCVGLFVAGFCGTALLVFGLHHWRRPAKPEPHEWREMIKIGLLAFAVLVVIPAMAVARFKYFGAGHADGEPFEWFEGISLWPTQVVRVVVCLLCVWFVFMMYFSFKQHKAQLRAEFRLPATPPCREPPSKLNRAADLGWRSVAWVPDVFNQAASHTSTRPWGAGLGDWLAKYGIVGWDGERASPGPLALGARSTLAAWRARSSEPVDAGKLWCAYVERGWWPDRLARSVAVLAIHTAFVGGLVLWLGLPRFPYRGDASWWTHWTLMAMAFLAVNGLIFVVWDATRLCDRFVHNLSASESQWPTEMQALMRERRGVEGIAANAWLDVQIIARTTDAVGRTIYYPFVVLLLLILSRNGRIDLWTWSFPVLLAYVPSAAVALVSAASMRRSAERAREHELGRLRDENILLMSEGYLPPDPLTPAPVPALCAGAGPAPAAALDLIVEPRVRRAGESGDLQSLVAMIDGTREVHFCTSDGDPLAVWAATGAAGPEPVGTAPKAWRIPMTNTSAVKTLTTGQLASRRAQIEKTIEEIRAIRTGAFGPFTHNPAVQAALLPFGGFGAVQLFEYVQRMM